MGQKNTALTAIKHHHHKINIVYNQTGSVFTLKIINPEAVRVLPFIKGETMDVTAGL
jgi:hypothetical protein